MCEAQSTIKRIVDLGCEPCRNWISFTPCKHIFEKNKIKFKKFTYPFDMNPVMLQTNIKYSSVS